MRIHTALAIMLMLAVVQPMPADEPLAKVEIARLGKAATVFVELPDARTTGSGFCINSDGLFITNAHVVEGGGRINVVVNSGTRAQKIYPATCIRTDAQHDLAVLKVTSDDTFKAVSLGSDEKLGELDEVIAFGFPFGSNLTPNGKDSPAMSVNSGTITALRLEGQKLDKIQLDATVNPGNSGGPVLDRAGKVIGVIVSRLRGASGINFAIPVSQVRQFITRPDLAFLPPVLTSSNLKKPVTFSARAMWMLPETKPLTLELVLANPGGGQRTFKMEQMKKEFIVVAEPVPESTRLRSLRVNAEFGSDSISGEIEDARVRIRNKEMLLSDVRQFTRIAGPHIQLADGTSFSGEIGGLEATAIKLGDETVSLNLSKAKKVIITNTSVVTSIHFTIKARCDGQEVATLVGRIPVDGGEAVAFIPANSVRPSSNGLPPPAGRGTPDTRSWMFDFSSNQIFDVVAGAGGDVLVLHQERQNRLAILDVKASRSEPKFKFIQLTKAKPLFAAGATKLMILYRETGVLERWNLNSAVKEASTTLKTRHPPGAMAMGAASEGPLLISGIWNSRRMENAFFDIGKMQRIEQAFNQENAFETQEPAKLSVSADGKLFACQAWPDIQIGTWDGQQLTKSRIPRLTKPLPGPDGKVIYSAEGRFHRATKKLDETFKNCIPAQRGPYFVTLSQEGNPRGAARFPGVMSYKAEIIPEGETTPIARVESIEMGILKPGEPIRGPIVPNDRQVFFLPDARLLVVIAPSGTRLQFYPVQLP